MTTSEELPELESDAIKTKSELRFNWREQDRDSFLSWLVVVSLPHGDGVIDPYSLVTNKFTDCRLAMQLNGIELNVAQFVASIQRNMDNAVRDEALRIVAESTNYDKIEAILDNARKSIRRQLNRQLMDVGIVVSEDEQEWS